MRIGPSHRNAIHAQQEVALRPLPTSAQGNVGKDLRRFVRDPKIAEQADRSRKLLPFRRRDVGQYSRMEDDERRVLWRLSSEHCEVRAKVAFDQPRFLLRSNPDRRAQSCQPIGLLRPHQRFQPAHLAGVREVDGLEVGPATSDWSMLAAQAADDIRRLDPETRRVERTGPLDLPAVVLSNGPAVMAFVLVHPFWRLDEEARRSGALAETIASLRGSEVYFLDTFEVARRPVKALENARNRPADRY